MSDAERANLQMVDRLIAQEALWSRPLIDAFQQTPRHQFVRRVYQNRRDGTWKEVRTDRLGPDELALVYSDRALTTRLSDGAAHEPLVPISSSSQPSLMAQMLEDLRLSPGSRVLEVGAGTGYNAALMAAGAGPGRVVSVDVDRRILAEAEQHLRAFPGRKVRILHADGRRKCPGGPFDRIIVTASTPDLEPAWLEQLAPGGLLLAPLALAPGLAFVVRGTAERGAFRGNLTRPAFFMPLRHEDETGEDEPPGPAADGSLETVPAPWSHWPGQRRGRLGSRGLLQSLAFHALLRGLRVSFQTRNDEVAFGLTDLSRGIACWVSANRWYVTGEGGRALGESLWRAFLDAGAPWPTEFDLEACPRGAAGAGGWETYERQGPHCRQVWRLREPRERPAAF